MLAHLTTSTLCSEPPTAFDRVPMWIWTQASMAHDNLAAWLRVTAVRDGCTAARTSWLELATIQAHLRSLDISFFSQFEEDDP